MGAIRYLTRIATQCRGWTRALQCVTSYYVAVATVTGAGGTRVCSTTGCPHLFAGNDGNDDGDQSIVVSLSPDEQQKAVQNYALEKLHNRLQRRRRQKRDDDDDVRDDDDDDLEPGDVFDMDWPPYGLTTYAEDDDGGDDDDDDDDDDEDVSYLPPPAKTKPGACHFLHCVTTLITHTQAAFFSATKTPDKLIDISNMQ